MISVFTYAETLTCTSIWTVSNLYIYLIFTHNQNEIKTVALTVPSNQTVIKKLKPVKSQVLLQVRKLGTQGFSVNLFKGTSINQC